ncbi:MAG TPA: LamG-like jellyroll fold domain-containing protein, partial [Nitrososphaeraceae archaeon]
MVLGVISFLLFLGLSSTFERSHSAFALADFNFGAAGDWGCTSNTKNVESGIVARSPERVLGLGDYSYEPTATCWLNIIQPTDSITKIAIGNHEDDDDEDYQKYISHFGLSNPYYSFNFNNVHVLVMDTDRTSSSSGSAQFNFVKSDLEAASQNPAIDWIIVTLHKPLYTSPNTCSSCDPSSTFRNTYHPLFDQNGVDLVLEGHVHNYQRTFPIKYNPSSPSSPTKTSSSTSSYNDPEGEIYAIVGTGGVNFHGLSGKSSFVASQQDSKFGYLDIVFTNDGATLQAKYYLNTGAVSDQFTISKTTGGNSPPVASAQSVTVTKDTAKPITLTATDPNGDSLTYSVVSQPTHGTLTGTAPSVTYTPQSGYTGTDSFTFKGNDGTVDSNVATVSITVNSGGGGAGYHYEPNFVSTGSNVQDTPSSSSLQIPKFTVSSWFKTSTNFGTEGFIVNKGGLGTDTAGLNMNYAIWMTSGEQLRAGFETGSGTDNFVTSTARYNDGLFHYATLTYDGAALRLYVDGAQVATTSTTSSPETSNTLPVRVGGNAQTADRFFTGNIDEVRIWNRALSAQEVLDTFNGIFNAPGQVLYLPFGSSSADTTPPTVTTRTPASGATGVAVGSSITATFSEAVQSGTVTGTTFTLK